jgi:uncharacterized protein (DUF433 family)
MVVGREIHMSTLIIEHIERTPGICGGRPRITGRRITVAHIASAHKEADLSAKEIASEFGLTLGQVHAALSYYYDHREEIEQSMRDDEAFAEEMRSRLQSEVQRKLSQDRQDGPR